MYEVLTDYGEFMERVGALMDADDFVDLDIDPDGFLAFFGRRHLPELLRFCRENPEYHIFSTLKDDSMLNGFTPKGTLFMLAEGDRNPNLAYSETGSIDLDQ